VPFSFLQSFNAPTVKPRAFQRLCQSRQKGCFANPVEKIGMKKPIKEQHKAKANNTVIKLDTGLFKSTAGSHYTRNGKLSATVWYLGNDEESARRRISLIRTEWKKCRADGHKVWMPNYIQTLADQGIASYHTAATATNGQVKPSDALIKVEENKAVKIDKYKDDKGIVINEAVPDFLLTLISQEYSSPEVIDGFRKFLAAFQRKDPKRALELWASFYKLKKESETDNQPQVTVNVANMIAADDSEKLQRIMEGGVSNGNIIIEDSDQVSDQSES
jgi:hypothetical protein